MATVLTVSGEAAQPDARASLVRHSARSVKWSLLYNLVPRLVTPFSTMVLAAILTPDDFGLVAISTFVIALARIVVDLGLGKTVIQRQTNVDEAASVSFCVGLLISAVLYLGLWVAAPAISAAYHNANVTAVIRTSALSLPLMAVATIPKALLKRDMRFRSLFWVNSSFLIVQSIASLALALAGFGYWALILGQLIGMLISSGLACITAHPRFDFVLSWPVLRSLLGFSVWVMVSGFQSWLFLYSDNAIAGLFLGVRELGIYALGFSVAVLLPGLVEASLGDVAYPAFCKLQASPREVGKSLVKLQTLTLAGLLPVASAVSALAPSVAAGLYGPKWAGLGAVISVLVIMPGLICIWALNENAYQAVGRPDVAPKLAAISLLVLLPALWLVAPHGLVAFTFARFAAAWILPLGNMLVTARMFGVGLADQLKRIVRPSLYAIVMYLFIWLLVQQIGPLTSAVDWLKLGLVTAAGGLLYLFLICIGSRGLWNELRFGARQVLS